MEKEDGFIGRDKGRFFQKIYPDENPKSSFLHFHLIYFKNQSGFTIETPLNLVGTSL